LTQDSLEIEELVRVVAAEESFAANRRLVRALAGVEFFFPMNISQRADGEDKATPLLRLPDGTHAMTLYTSKSHPDLPDSFGGGRLKDALTAALKMPALDWVIVSNRASQRLAIHKDQIGALLQDDPPPNASTGAGAGSPPVDDSTDKMVEDLITRAVHTAPEDLSPPIGSVLQGRELYLELNPDISQADQIFMKTFQVQHLANVVRAYLTRSRSDITYGGIKWEELKEMLRKEPQINGIQLINDADDWVVFDRESLGLPQ
jgi:hypothetical protein